MEIKLPWGLKGFGSACVVRVRRETQGIKQKSVGGSASRLRRLRGLHSVELPRDPGGVVIKESANGFERRPSKSPLPGGFWVF